jgi:hypothetical protein
MSDYTLAYTIEYSSFKLLHILIADNHPYGENTKLTELCPCLQTQLQKMEHSEVKGLYHLKLPMEFRLILNALFSHLPTSCLL